MEVDVGYDTERESSLSDVIFRVDSLVFPCNIKKLNIPRRVDIDYYLIAEGMSANEFNEFVAKNSLRYNDEYTLEKGSLLFGPQVDAPPSHIHESGVAYMNRKFSDWANKTERDNNLASGTLLLSASCTVQTADTSKTMDFGYSNDRVNSPHPLVAGEIVYSTSLTDAHKRANFYLQLVDGGVDACLVVEIGYPWRSNIVNNIQTYDELDGHMVYYYYDRHTPRIPDHSIPGILHIPPSRVVAFGNDGVTPEQIQRIAHITHCNPLEIRGAGIAGDPVCDGPNIALYVQNVPASVLLKSAPEDVLSILGTPLAAMPPALDFRFDLYDLKSYIIRRGVRFM